MGIPPGGWIKGGTDEGKVTGMNSDVWVGCEVEAVSWTRLVGMGIAVDVSVPIGSCV